MSKADIGLIGLAVMGQNLALNMSDHGFRVSVYNRTWEKTQAFMDGPARNSLITGTRELVDLVKSLERPRKVLLMVRAGKVVDQVIGQLLPLLEPGDIILDGGNSRFTDTNRRVADLRKRVFNS